MTIVVAVGLAWVGLCLSSVAARLSDLAGEVRRGRLALEAQNQHYGIPATATIDEEDADGH